ncbi:MAG: SPOR domain-containing protein [Gammaproteobacteria bacterium]|nr:SPOR domain-containing protein [Gammaproteobacteria bacterium]NIR82049.1 SPOR domain-containing protein [Gammaproteobacteria bacterium]NIR89277.1 SPOR domain-containing protein [Gammaproteobacteria bacterium]NIU03159.1 SPOR domain-containing protein [Gammaproteobacteria bacterium]NIV50675.1 hypothetical protein [Gammaproteobacteria bacterium]
MRWIFSLLLLTNVVFFLWQFQAKQSPPAGRPTADQPIPGHVNRLLRLSEVDRTQLRVRSLARAREPDASSDDTPEDTTAEALPVCYTVGPLQDEDRIAQVDVWLSERDGATSLRVGEWREVNTYWVYLPPFPSVGEAKAQQARMREQGISDIYVIPGGNMAGAVSLGLYSQRRTLERRMQQLHDKGYSPEVQPRYKTTKASWIEVEFPAGFEFPEVKFANEFPEVNAQRTACEGQGIARRPLPPE